MNVTEFKIWFKGLTAGMSEESGFTPHQVKALADAVKDLDSDKLVDVSSTPKDPGDSGPAPGPVPGTLPVFDVDSLLKELDRINVNKCKEITTPRDPWYVQFKDNISLAHTHDLEDDRWFSTLFFDPSWILEELEVNPISSKH